MRMRTSELSARAISGETIILDLRSSRYLSVTGVGTRIVELLAQDRTMDELVDTLADEYEAPRAVVRVDAEKFVARLGDAGLIEH
jgi:Coenzyme PQQ synthesis protein D (PqqD)